MTFGTETAQMIQMNHTFVQSAVKYSRKKIARDRHEKRKHFSEKNHACEICSKAFVSATRLKIHMRTHTGEKPFQCQVCARRFTQRHQLNTHMRVHTGETPYECMKCFQKFKFMASRNSHKCMYNQ